VKKTHFKQFFGVLSILSLCLFEVACKAPRQKAESKMVEVQPQNRAKKATPVFTGKDTCKVKHGEPEILAYAPSKAEIDALPDSAKDDFNESYSDFMYYWHEFADHPGKIKADETGARFILIGDSTIDKDSLKENAFGIIFVSRTGHFKIFEGQTDKREIEKNSRSFAW